MMRRHPRGTDAVVSGSGAFRSPSHSGLCPTVHVSSQSFTKQAVATSYSHWQNYRAAVNIHFVWTVDEVALADSLEAVFQRLACARTESELNSLVDADLSISQLRCLVTLAQEGQALAIHTLAERLGMTVASMGRAVDRLVAQELVTRREAPDDRRVRQVALSAKGRQAVSGIDEARQRSLLTFVRSLDPADASRLLAALRPIVGAWSNEPQPLEGNRARHPQQRRRTRDPTSSTPEY
jgi:DNA-binding MarR family transcriptional regulator